MATIELTGPDWKRIKGTLKTAYAPGDLDFALLKLAQEQRGRGWIDLSTSPPLPEPSSFAAIVQHPASGPGTTNRRGLPRIPPRPGAR